LTQRHHTDATGDHAETLHDRNCDDATGQNEQPVRVGECGDQPERDHSGDDDRCCFFGEPDKIRFRRPRGWGYHGLRAGARFGDTHARASDRGSESSPEPRYNSWSRSGSSRNSAQVPWYAMLPERSTAAVLPISSARLANCSTSRIPGPASRSSRTESISRSNARGDRPSDNSSISNARGLRRNARASTSICCSPPESSPLAISRRLASSGNMSKASSHELSGAATWRFSRVVSSPKMDRPCSTWAIPPRARW